MAKRKKARVSNRAHEPSFSPWAILELIRLPLVFTAIADSIMGYLVTHDELAPLGPFLLLLAASCCFYWSGMVLNDLFDIAQDREQRPLRPLPSGRISLHLAKRLGFGLLLAGLLLSSGASLLAADARPVCVAATLAICIVLYNRALKKTSLAPIAMGACRACNVLLAMSTAPFAWQNVHATIAGGIGIYIVGVTLFARTEAQASRRTILAAGLLILLTGMATLAWMPTLRDPPTFPTNWLFFWAMLSGMILWRSLRAIASPTPRLVQIAVRSCLTSLIVLDAAVTFAFCGREWAFVVLLLLFPSTFLGRWLDST